MEMLKEYLGPDNYEIFTNAQLNKMKTPADVVKALQAKGYDGIKYSNYFEGEQQHYIPANYSVSSLSN